MKTISKVIFPAALLIILTSCDAFAARPTEMFRPTETSLPAEITSAPLISTPSEKQPGDWEGVPIMPGAFEGNDDLQSYAFIINDQVDNVTAFYQRKMAVLGWSLTKGAGNEMQSFMTFKKGEKIINVSVALQSDGRTSVKLEKGGQEP